MEKQKHIVFLSAGNGNLALEMEARVEGIVERFLGLLTPIQKIIDASVADAMIELLDYETFSIPEGGVSTGEFKLRTSSAKPFNLTLSGFETENGSIFVDTANRTAFVLQSKENRLKLYISDLSLYHFVETIRYTLLAIEQTRGAIILHASAACSANEALLILGNKGSGKTTTLLNLVVNHNCGYFSGDKVLVDKWNGGVRFRAWPDFPHIGYGTLSAFPTIAARLGFAIDAQRLEPAGAREKILINPNAFLSALGGATASSLNRCSALIFPNVLSHFSDWRTIDEHQIRYQLLKEAVEDARDFLPGQWHNLVCTRAPVGIDEIVAELAECKWVEVHGSVLPSSYLGR